MNQNKRIFIFTILGGISLALFLLLILLLETVEVASVSPSGAAVGLSSLNGAVFQAIGTNALWYDISEILGLVVLLIPVIFGILALAQWISRRNLLRIDFDLWILFHTYAVTLFLYCFFEIVVINERPVLIDGVLEPSFPSSHTLLAIVITGSAALQIRSRVSNIKIKIPLLGLCALLFALIPISRLLSGVHWLTDIFASILLGASLLSFYHAAILFLSKKSLNKKATE